jgi:FkbM family methyltransferase
MIMNLLSIFLLFSSACFAIDQLPYCCSISAMNYAKQYLPKDPIILECGAYDGHDTVSMAISWPKGIIHTFEPVPIMFDILKQNTGAFTNIHAYQLALGDFCGKSIFYISKLNGETIGSSSLLPPKEHLRLNAARFDNAIEVDVLTLDTWAALNRIDHVDYLWLDMQGYELNMLKASKLAKRAKVIYIEVEFIQLYEDQYLYKDILEWMSKNNFELVAKDFDDSNLDFGNAVFVKKRLLKKLKQLKVK